MSATQQMVPGFDGQPLAVHRVGAGRPVLLLHGLFSEANTNWIKFGQAQRLADAGFEAIMPDLRAHGASAKPHDPAAYPRDVLVRDEPLDCEFVEEGDLYVYRTAKRQAADARDHVAVLERLGIEVQRLRGEQVEAMEPALKPGVIGGLLHPGDARLRRIATRLNSHDAWSSWAA